MPSCFLGLLLQRLVADVVGRQRGRILALFGDFVVDETRGFVAALQAGVDAIEAQVERIAGQRVDVARVLAYGTARRAREAAIQFFIALADGHVSVGGRLPCAGAGPGRPDETAGAGDLGGHAVFARAEDVALGRIRMREDAVQSRAVWVHLLRLLREQLEIAAVDVVRIVAGIAAGPASRIEDETVGAQALSGHAVSAVPVAVAVCVVRVLAVLRVGALEAVGQRRSGQSADRYDGEEPHDVR